DEANKWLAGFTRLVRGDATEAASLFVKDCYWRDLLAVTGTMKTMGGVDNIVAGLTGIARQGASAAECVASRDFAPTTSLLAGRTVFELFADLELPVGRVVVLARLI